MKTNITNTVLILSLHLAVLACSKIETNDMMFKQALTAPEQSMAQPVPGEVRLPSDEQGTQDRPETPSSQDGVPFVVVTNGEVKDPVVVKEETKDPIVDPVVVKEETKDPVVDPVVVKEETKDPVVDPVVVKEETKDPVVDPVVVKEETKDPVVDPVVVKEETKDTVVVVTTEEKEEEAPYVPYPDSAIPSCKLNLKSSGAGSASKIALASASKAELMSAEFDGFESLSAAELANMRTAVDKLVSGNGVQVLKSGDSFKKDSLVNGKALIVTDGKSAVDLDLSGLGKGSQVYLMNVSEKHNTVCVLMNGSTSSSQVYLSAKGDSKYVTRADLDFNGSGSSLVNMKVLGGHQTGSNFINNGLKDSKLIMITEGLNDTFSSIKGNMILRADLDLRLKGKNDAGMGISAEGMSKSKLHMELEGADRVKSIMAVKAMLDNEVDGWMKYKSDGKLDPSLTDLIDVSIVP